MGLVEVADGEKFFLDGTKLPDGVLFEYMGVPPFVTFNFKNPSLIEIEAVRSGSLQIGVYMYRNAIVLPIYSPILGGYFDCTFNSKLYPEPPKLKFYEHGTGIPLMFIMVDSRDNMIKSHRISGMGTRWSNTFMSYLKRQQESNYSPQEFALNLDEIYGRMSPKELFKQSIVYKLGTSE